MAKTHAQDSFFFLPPVVLAFEATDVSRSHIRKCIKKSPKGRKVVLTEKSRHITNTVIFCYEAAPFVRPSAKIAQL